MQGTIKIGTSGWSYDHWDGVFYPKGTHASDRLGYYATVFQTVEVNATFYRLPSEKTLKAWRDATPSGFAFAVKGSRFITHYRRLHDAAESVNVFMNRISVLGDKLSVVLWQLPPDLTVDVELLEEFLAALPRGVRHAVEFRHQSWLTERPFETLRAGDVAHVHVSSDVMPVDLTQTADFAYVRFHGLAGYHGAYVEPALEPWCVFLRARRNEGCDGYVYFNNDAEAHAPADAARLRAMLGR